MKIGSLFSGIGGLELGLERSGIGSVTWQCEIDPWCRKVLKKNWPLAVRVADVREVTRESVSNCEIVCGGFPCQPVSVAGMRRAGSDERWLWPEFARVVAEIEPSIVVAENVPGLRSAGLRGVLADLADLGFDAEWSDLGAFEAGAPHIRRRLFIVATHPDRVRICDDPGWLSRSFARQAAAVSGSAVAHFAPDADGMRRLESARRFAELGRWSEYCGWRWDPTQGVDDGISGRLDVGRRRKALGNAVVVRCAEFVGVAIRAAISGACVASDDPVEES